MTGWPREVGAADYQLKVPGACMAFKPLLARRSRRFHHTDEMRPKASPETARSHLVPRPNNASWSSCPWFFAPIEAKVCSRTRGDVLSQSISPAFSFHPPLSLSLSLAHSRSVSRPLAVSRSLSLSLYIYIYLMYIYLSLSVCLFI